MRTSKKRALIACVSASLLAVPLLTAGPASAAAGSQYTWSNVTIGAGGFVTGVVYSPTQPGLAYLRTDIGGLYRWNAFTQTWTPLPDSTTFADENELGVDSVATDPIHPNRVFAAVGEYAYSWNDGAPSAILSSDDYGKTWQTYSVPFEIGSNDQGHDSGERLVVDPNDDNVLYYGTEDDGLWKSTDGGKSWAKDALFPDAGSDSAAGLQFVTFDQTEHHIGRPTQHIVVGDADTTSLYETTDGGSTWSTITTGPGTVPIKAQFASNGDLYVVYDQYTGPYWMGTGKLYKFAAGTDSATGNGAVGTATDITPEGDENWWGYDGLAVDPNNPDTVYVATNDRWNPVDTIYRSTDGGETFTSAATGLSAVSNDQLLTMPGHAGELYFAAQTGGLQLSTDGGTTWTQVNASQVTAMYTVGEGAAAPGSRYETLYLVGTVDGVTGFYMSTDAGARWTKINSSQQNFGWIPTIVGDPNHFGRVYLGTNGRGIQTIDVANQGW